MRVYISKSFTGMFMELFPSHWEENAPANYCKENNLQIKNPLNVNGAVGRKKQRLANMLAERLEGSIGEVWLWQREETIEVETLVWIMRATGPNSPTPAKWEEAVTPTLSSWPCKASFGCWLCTGSSSALLTVFRVWKTQVCSPSPCSLNKVVSC